MVLLTDNSLCRDCQACVLGCSLWHEGECNPSLSRVSVTKDMAKYKFEISVCKQCETPACVAVCPSEALVIDNQGIVILLEDNCTKCGNCMEACPYNAIFFNANQNRYIKCDMCVGRAEGPLCAILCPAGAITLEQDKQKENC